MSGAPSRPPLELWGGIECTRNRVGDGYRDQFAWSGHDRRPADLDRIAELGVRALRYPALWEYAAPQEPTRLDWAWADQRLGRLRTLGLRPIVGLVHHGSGPVYTSLVDASFPEGLAAYAGQLARRFPWVADYTPVNEPLTTARFSALYGHWYPHARDDRLFALAMLHQCKATVLAMRAVREVRPDARLVQTEDLGRASGSAALAYQVEFENERRWLTFDLLCGRVDRHHPVGGFLLWLGVPERELAWFQANPCPPDVIGVNHYLTSDRYLDDRVSLYPNHCVGSNGRDLYADVESVRVLAEGAPGVGSLLAEAWQRYGLPLAVTEAHLGCTREEQLRWLYEVWRAARAAREQGADVRAVTVWSLLGAFGWDSLVTADGGTYEPGAFDVRGPQPRPTALAGLARDLARAGDSHSPLLVQAGWWRRDERLYPFAAPPRGPAELDGPPLLITGGNGTLGRAFARLCAVRGLACRLLGRAEADIADEAAVRAALDQYRPWAVVNAAGYSRIDEAEHNPDRCFRDNTRGAEVLAAACAAAGLPLLTFSSSHVFDGRQRSPYREADRAEPLNAYGRSKAEAERRVLAAHRGALVVRSSAFFGPWDELNFVAQSLRLMAGGEPVEAAGDVVVSPTYLPDLIHASLDLLIDGESGVWHLANQGEVAWAELARVAAGRAGLDADLVRARPARALGWAAPRPPYSALGSERGLLLAPLENALDRYLAERPRRVAG